MIRAATPKGILDIVAWLVVSLLIGALAMKIAKRMGAPMNSDCWPSPCSRA